ncbi:MAG: zinc-binding dehydrogenase [Chitinophagales bacterium]|nr:zinc-binding dehydrogenase [Chitinophagales bacterium]MCZ2394253.1 zinc-binding dehydrogenase [Chitinophagales bacterium]
MKALIINEQGLHLAEVEKPVVASGNALVKISASALNRRDQWIREGLYPKIELPVLPGSDACGEVIQVGDPIDTSWIGKRVIINPNNNWGENPKIQNRDYHILGMPTKGTLAEYISVPVDRLVNAPLFLSDEEAAALPLGGLTAYNAIVNKGELAKDKKVLISGVGGGVAQFAFQFALAVDAQVWVTSGKENVIGQCVALGARGGVNYKEPQAIKSLSKSVGGFDIIIDSAGGDGINTLLEALAPGGKYVLYGATKGLPSTLNLRNIFWNQLSVLGSTMGSDQDFSDMVQFVKKYQIHPIIDSIFSLTDGVQAFDHMKSGNHFGKIVVKP